MSAQDALSLIPYGVHIVTARRADEVGAFICSWLMQVSFEPLLVALAVDKQSRSFSLLDGGRVFALNFVSGEHTRLVNRLATPHRISPHKFLGLAWTAGATGAPILDEAFAYIECGVTNVIDTGGDHSLFIGTVVGGEVRKPESSLTLAGSGLRYR